MSFTLTTNKNKLLSQLLFRNQIKKAFCVFCNKSSHNTLNVNTPSSLISYGLISKNNDIGLLTIKNSPKRNALSYEILTGLIAQLDKIDQDFVINKFPRVLIINSEGSVFSSGHDLKELASFSDEQRIRVFTACADLMIKIQKSNCVVIAEVQGLATAAGCQLAASCDLIVASSKAKFETPGVRIGLFCSSPSVALSRAISAKRAMHMLVTGEAISADKALDWGLVNEIVNLEGVEKEEEKKEKLREATLKLAEHINQYSGEALSFGKKTFYTQIAQTYIDEAYKIAGKAMCTNLGFNDTKEGISAFLQKRKPSFNTKL